MFERRDDKSEHRSAVYSHRFSLSRPLCDTCHTGLTLGSGGVLPRSRYHTPGLISVQPWDAMVCHPFAPLAGSGAGSERVNYEHPQSLLAGWLPFRRFEPGAPPTTAWRHRREIDAASRMSLRCPRCDWSQN